MTTRNIYAMPDWTPEVEAEFWRLYRAGYSVDTAQEQAPVNIEKLASMRGRRIEEG